jgi:hypothetical protein
MVLSHPNSGRYRFPDRDGLVEPGQDRWPHAGVGGRGLRLAAAGTVWGKACVHPDAHTPRRGRSRPGPFRPPGYTSRCATAAIRGSLSALWYLSPEGHEPVE